MIQDIYPYVLDNQYANRKDINDDDYILSFEKGNIMISLTALENNVLEFPKAKDFKNLDNITYYFSISGRQYFYIDSDEVPDGYDYFSIRDTKNKVLSPDYQVYAMATAKHLHDWYRDNQYCGRCGKKMSHSNKERALKCECGYRAYPRIMPAVIVGIKNGDSILLTRYKTGFKHNALVAGFIEIGETVEEAVIREVKEEVGVNIKNITYYKSQPWGTANDILLGYYCELDGDPTIHMDDNELKYAEWVKREDIILQPDNYSLTNEMMRMFKEGKQ
ncbi:MAG: NAD(+) diphosphatase [Erysipelotrichaceae bacterium]|nr:NAD(+) diphosphatase [Erysipelotrichaceae bacterium]